MRATRVVAVVAVVVAVALTLQAARDSRPVDSRFHDQFWRELLWDDFERPGVLLAEQFRAGFYNGQPDPFGRDRFRMPDVYIWHDQAPRGAVRFIREHLPGLWMEMTGRPFTGRILSGNATWRERPHTIGIRFQPLRTACGRAGIGPDWQGWTLMRLDPTPRCLGVDPDPHGYFAHLLAHELGHTLGFFHVEATNTVISGGRSIADWPSPRERYHMRLAYEVGSHHYCGWPYGPSCSDVSGLQPSAVRPVVVD